MPTRASSPDIERPAAMVGTIERMGNATEPVQQADGPVPGMVYEVVHGSGDQVAAQLAERVRGTGIVWLMRSGSVRRTACAVAPGCVGPGTGRQAVLFCDVQDDAEAGWAAEEALRTPGVGLVVVELAVRDPARDRRLARAAAEGGGIGLVLWLEQGRHRFMSLPVEMRSDDTALAVAPTGQPAHRSVSTAAPTRWKAAFA